MSGRAARCWQLAAFVTLFLFARTGRAACPDDVEAWARACAATTGVELSLAACGPEQINVEAKLADERLGLGVRGDGVGFRRVGRFGVSPLGQFPDWKAEPASRRDALDAVVRCVANHPDALTRWAKNEPPARERGPGRALYVAAIATLGLAWMAVRARGRRELAAALGAAIAAAALRSMALDFAFFHQNGQGPLWTSFSGELADYGEGFAQLFSLAARATPRAPEQGVFVANSALGAATVGFAWLTTERASGSRSLAWVVALLVAVDPVAARVAGSESYFAVLTCFAWAATLSLVWASTARGLGALGVLVAGLFVAASALVHPLAWAPMAALPLVAFVARPALAIRRAPLIALAIAVVTAVVAGASIHAVLTGALGREWARPNYLHLRDWQVWALVAAGVATLVRGRAATGPLGAALIAVAWIGLTFPLDSDHALVIGAYLRMGAPPAIALAAAAWRARWIGKIASSLALAAFLLSLPKARADATTRFTDTEETSWARVWRARLPDDADVCFVTRNGRATLALPLGYAVGPKTTRIDSERPWTTAGCTHYYRAALCESSEGGQICDDVEATIKLEPIEARELVARSSQPWRRYQRDTVRVGLYRVVAPVPRTR